MGEETKISIADAYASAQRAEGGMPCRECRPGIGVAAPLLRRVLLAVALVAGVLPGVVLDRFPGWAGEVWAGPSVAAAAGLVSGAAAWALCALRCVWRPGGVFGLWLVCALATVGGDWIARAHLFGPRPSAAAFAAEAAAILLASACVAWFAARPRFFCRDCGRRGRGGFRVADLCILVPESRAFVQLASGDVSPLLSASPVAQPGRTVVTVDVRFCTACCRGAMWVARTGAAGRSAKEPRLQGVELEPDAVRGLLELSRRSRIS